MIVPDEGRAARHGLLPPAEITVPLSTPPRSFMRPPLLTTVALAVPPDETLSEPLLPGLPTSVATTSALTARPPDEDIQDAGVRQSRTGRRAAGRFPIARARAARTITCAPSLPPDDSSRSRRQDVAGRRCRRR